MRNKRWVARWALLALVAQAVLAAAAAPASASRTDAALFYEVLAPHGTWVDYRDYGPVWRPAKVAAGWRPYLDGRWVPTTEGWVFETQEAWGWATYHFGNWMPTEDLGWVWVPGSTWYPSTVAWRVGGDFVGWAPVPPPDFTPPPAFAGKGYAPGAPVSDLLTSPFWIFVNAPNLLLGFGQPYLPAYSFVNCGCLAPSGFVPVIYPRTFLLADFSFPRFAPRAFFAFGPPFSSVAVFTGQDLPRLNKFARSVNLKQLQNVLPRAAVFAGNPFIRKAIPAPVLKGERFQMRPAPNPLVAERHLVRPGVIPAPPGVPRLTAEIPRVLAAPKPRPVPEIIRGTRIVRGAGLPPQAELEERVLRHRFPRPQPAEPALGAIGVPAGGQVQRQGRAFFSTGRRRWPLTTEEENLKRQLEEELLLEQVLRARRFHRRFEAAPERSRGQLHQGLGPIIPPIQPPGGRPAGRAYFGPR